MRGIASSCADDVLGYTAAQSVLILARSTLQHLQSDLIRLSHCDKCKPVTAIMYNT